jgi:hypothetical protein
LPGPAFATTALPLTMVSVGCRNPPFAEVQKMATFPANFLPVRIDEFFFYHSE